MKNVALLTYVVLALLVKVLGLAFLVSMVNSSMINRF